VISGVVLSRSCLWPSADGVFRNRKADLL